MHHINFVCYIILICKLYQRCVLSSTTTIRQRMERNMAGASLVSLPGEPNLNEASLQLLIDSEINYQYILYTFKCFRFTRILRDCATETT